MTVLMRTDPFREFDRLTQQVFGTNGTANKPAVMPMDAYKSGNDYIIQFDLPGVTPESIDLDVEKNVLTVRAERRLEFDEDAEVNVTERPRGVYSRQLFLGDTLDTDSIEANYSQGVLTLTVPIAEQAKPRKIEVGSSDSVKQIDA